MLGSLVLKRRRFVKAANPYTNYPVLSDYHRDMLTGRAHRRLAIAFFIVSILFGFLFAALPDESKPLLTIPLFVMAALIVWLLPETGRPPTRFMVRMFFCYFLALILWPYYLAIQLPGAPLIEIRRAFLVLAILGLLVSLSVSEAFKRDMKDIMASVPFFFKLFLGFVTVQTLSLVGTPDIARAFMAYLRVQLACTAVLFITVYVMSKPGRVLFFANMIRFVAVVLAIIAILEYQNQGILWADHIPPFLQVSDPAMLRLLSPVFRAGEYRVTATFSVSLCLAEFLSLTLPFFLQYIVVGRNLFYKIVLIICDILVIDAILMTQARVGIVGIMVTHGIYGFIWSIRFWRTRKESVFGPVLAMVYPVGLVLFGLAMIFVGRLRGMWMGGAVEGASTLGRLEQAAAFPPVFLRRPLFGYGPGQGGQALSFRNPAGEMSIDSALLSVPLDYGFFGFVLYYAMFIYMLIKGMKLAFEATEQEASYAMPVAVTLAFWLTSRIVLAQEDNASFMFMMLGTLVALIYQRQKLNSTSDVQRASASSNGDAEERRSSTARMPGQALGSGA